MGAYPRLPLGAQWCGDDGHERRRLLGLRRTCRHRYPNGFTYADRYRDANADADKHVHVDADRRRYADADRTDPFAHAGRP